ncbi:HlyD family efflux transporter periplasmic adaptor subunit [Rhodohalobacter sp. SW132]|uniref:HlyD family secretion protein n=1 Tax=Rhodohalobacter sp. SW132 TaxID=2293433 RepID=UPI000E245938|nr:HlyD family efflux transporter periplasmic adaptor subunit [Rhodohalobacter sp. SW132]REL33384.1 HlyD family efflux transporter periplasmic adaptor subunit [Rhodohalobacter sp. SW132]
MNKELFPKEIIENSQEHNFSIHSVRSRVIYSTIVLSLIGMFALLPFIYTDVGVRSQGMVRPVTEVIQIASPVSAQITSLQAKENSRVQKGDILLKLDDADIQQQLRFNRSRFEQLSNFIQDLNTLTKSVSIQSVPIDDLKTVRFKQETLEFRQQLENQQQLIDQQKRLLERETNLYNRDAISLLSLEERQHQLQFEENKLKLLTEQQFNRWNREKDTFQKERDEIEATFNQLSNEKRRYVIHSPVTGTLQNTNGLLENSFVFVNQAIGEISPDTTLIAEVYVLPNEIGLLRPGLPVRFQIDAYDHNQWGTATGKIESISTDILVSENTPMFKVRCSIDQTYLELSNGFKGEIKKGMTFQARFVINRRSLFQLLYDNMDDWLNPSWSATQDNNSRLTHINQSS